MRHPFAPSMPGVQDKCSITAHLHGRPLIHPCCSWSHSSFVLEPSSEHLRLHVLLFQLGQVTSSRNSIQHPQHASRSQHTELHISSRCVTIRYVTMNEQGRMKRRCGRMTAAHEGPASRMELVKHNYICAATRWETHPDAMSAACAARVCSKGSASDVRPKLLRSMRVREKAPVSHVAHMLGSHMWKKA